LWSLRKKGLQDGVLTLIYLVSYSFIRFFIAFTSSYQIVALGLNQAQIISILVFAGCIPFFVITILKKQSSSI